MVLGFDDAICCRAFAWDIPERVVKNQSRLEKGKESRTAQQNVRRIE